MAVVLYLPVNWLAVVAGTAGAFALGGIWYSSKLFGTKWAQGSHIKPVDGHPPLALIIHGLGTFFMAWIIGIAISTEAWLVIPLVIFAVASSVASSCLISQKSRYAVITETGFVIANGTIMLFCQAIL